MANTVIQLKKSATPSQVPANLANGELAINYADGKLFYKDSSGNIQEISGSGGNAFSTVNAAGTFIVADIPGDILTFDQGNNIIITADFMSHKINIAADLTAANSWANTKLSNGTITLDGALTTTGQIYANQQITVYPLGGGEGGEIQLWGSDSYPDWSIDSYQDSLRFFTLNAGSQIISFFNGGTGNVKVGINTGNPGYEIDVVGDVNVTGAFRVNGTPITTGGGSMDYPYANSVGIAGNTYANAVGLSSNNFAGVMANSANAYAASLTPDLSSIYLYANNVGDAGNANLSVVSISANNFAGAMVNSANAYIVTVGIAGNTYTNAVSIAANTWANTKLSNTDGVTFAGSLNVTNTLYAYDLVLANSMIANISGDVYNMNVRHDLYIGNNITNVSSIIFNTSTNRSVLTAGELTWSQDDSTLHFDMDTPGNVIQHVGQDLFYLVKNQTGSTITKGTAVRFSGTLGVSGRLLVTPAIADNSVPSKYIMGVAADNIANGDDGFVITQGKLRKVDTSMFSEGDILYLSPTTTGAFQNTMPTAPNNKITMAAVITKDNNNGVLQIRVTLGSKLDEDELAELNGLTNGDVLVYNSSPGRFENKVQLSLNAGSVDGWTTNNIIDTANAYSRVFANSVGTAGNANLSVATISANNFAGVMANSANGYANSTFVKLTSPSQTITGDFSITGNLFIGGNTTAISANNIIVDDPLIYLANNNIADLLDIGFVGSYINVNSAHVHTGLYRDHASKQYYLFQGYDANPEKINEITPYSNNMVNATLVADLITSNLTLGGANAIVWIGASFDKANAANLLAYGTGIGANAYADAVGTAGNANLSVATVSANNWANTKVASVSGTSGQIYSSGGTTPTLNLISTGVTATTYGGSTQIPVISVDDYGRLTSASNVAVSGMDYPFVNTATESANNFAGSMANSANIYAMSFANSKFLANTTNTVFSGNLITSGVVRSTGLQDSTGRLLLIKDSAGTVVWGN